MITGHVKVETSWADTVGGWNRAATKIGRDVPKDVLIDSAKFLEQRARYYAPRGSTNQLGSTLKAKVTGEHTIDISSDARYFLPVERGYEEHWIPVEYFYQASPGEYVKPVTAWRLVGSTGKHFVRHAVEDLRLEIGFKTLSIIRKHLREALHK